MGQTKRLPKRLQTNTQQAAVAWLLRTHHASERARHLALLLHGGQHLRELAAVHEHADAGALDPAVKVGSLDDFSHRAPGQPAEGHHAAIKGGIKR